MRRENRLSLYIRSIDERRRMHQIQITERALELFLTRRHRIFLISKKKIIYACARQFITYLYDSCKRYKDEFPVIKQTFYNIDLCFRTLHIVKRNSQEWDTRTNIETMCN